MQYSYSPAVAAAAAVSSVVSDSVQSHRWQPTRLRYLWDSPGKNTGVGCHFLLQCMKVKSLSHVQLFATPWTAAYQAPPSIGFSRQEYWGGLPLPCPSYSPRKLVFRDVVELLQWHADKCMVEMAFETKQSASERSSL